MNAFSKSLLPAVALSLVMAASAQAQSAPSQGAVIAACTGAGSSTQSCNAALNAFAAGLRAQGLTAAQVDAAIGSTVAAVASSPSANPVVVAAAARTAAAQVSNPTQAAALVQVAATVETGGAPSAQVLAQASTASAN